MNTHYARTALVALISFSLHAMDTHDPLEQLIKTMETQEVTERIKLDPTVEQELKDLAHAHGTTEVLLTVDDAIATYQMSINILHTRRSHMIGNLSMLACELQSLVRKQSTMDREEYNACFIELQQLIENAKTIVGQIANHLLTLTGRRDQLIAKYQSPPQSTPQSTVKKKVRKRTHKKKKHIKS